MLFLPVIIIKNKRLISFYSLIEAAFFLVGHFFLKGLGQIVLTLFLFLYYPFFMLKLAFMVLFFFLGYFLADTKLVEIPFKDMPYIEKLYEVVDD